MLEGISDGLIAPLLKTDLPNADHASWSLNISIEGVSTASLRDLLQFTITHRVQKFFLVFM